MRILVLNSGSSSLKYKFFDMDHEKALITGNVDGIGLDRCALKLNINGAKEEQEIIVKDHVDAVLLAFKSLKQKGIIKNYSEIDAVGHRVVHGGENYSQPVIINARVIKTIHDLYDLAPLHNPPNLAGIIASRKILPKIPQIAVFDTAFHQTLSPEAYLYGLPYELYEKHKIRKYGFHGPSHKYLTDHAIKLLGKKETRIITCHLGNGASLAAVKNGKSIDTTMGFTPLEGLIMGTRTGNMDPTIPIYLVVHKGFKVHELEDYFNKKSGLLGISGLTRDVRDLHIAAVKGDKKAKLALDMFARRVAFYIGGYMALLGGLDAIVFSAGIGENAWFMRKAICQYLAPIGILLDEKNNKNNPIIASKPNSKVKIYIIPTNEELQIARETKQLVENKR